MLLRVMDFGLDGLRRALIAFNALARRICGSRARLAVTAVSSSLSVSISKFPDRKIPELQLSFPTVYLGLCSNPSQDVPNAVSRCALFGVCPQLHGILNCRVSNAAVVGKQ